MTENNGHALRAISMAMRIKWYVVERITQYSRSRTTLDATGHCHWASIHPVLPSRCHAHQFYHTKKELWHCWNRLSKLAFKRHETDPLLISSK